MNSTIWEHYYKTNFQLQMCFSLIDVSNEAVSKHNIHVNHTVLVGEGKHQFSFVDSRSLCFFRSVTSMGAILL